MVGIRGGGFGPRHGGAAHGRGLASIAEPGRRKPGTAMLTAYLNNPAYDIANSFVIGDRITDVQLAKNLGCRAIWLNNDPHLGAGELNDSMDELRKAVALAERLRDERFDLLFLNPGIMAARNLSPSQASDEDLAALFFTNAVAPLRAADALAALRMLHRLRRNDSLSPSRYLQE